MQESQQNLGWKAFKWLISALLMTTIGWSIENWFLAPSQSLMNKTEVNVRFAAAYTSLAFGVAALICLGIMYAAVSWICTRMFLGHGRLGFIITATVCSLSIALGVLGIAPWFSSVRGELDSLRIVKGQYETAEQAYHLAIGSSLPRDFRQLPPRSGSIVNGTDSDAMLVNYYPHVFVTNPLACATFYLPQDASETNHYTFGFIFRDELGNTQTVLLRQDGYVTSMRWNGYRHVGSAGLLYPVHGNGEYDHFDREGDALDFCVLMDENYINVYMNGVLRMSWINSLGNRKVRVGVAFNEDGGRRSTAHILYYERFRLYPTESTTLYIDAPATIPSPVPEGTPYASPTLIAG